MTQIGRDAFQMLVSAWIEKNHLSAARAEAVRDAADMLRACVVTEAANEALGLDALQIISKLEAANKEANRKFQDLTDVSTGMPLLDEHAAQAHFLATCLMKMFTTQVRGSSLDVNGRLDCGVAREAIRATSYIVWAYLTGGSEMPSELQGTE